MKLTQQEYEKVKEVFDIFLQDMNLRENKNKKVLKDLVADGYSIAIGHMKKEVNYLLSSYIPSHIQIQPDNTDMISKTEVIEMLREMQIESAKCCGFFVGHVTQLWVIKSLLGKKIHELGGKAYTVDKEGNVVDEAKESEE